MANIYGLYLEEKTNSVQIEHILDLIGPTEREKIHKLRFEEDIKRSTYAELMVRYLACTKLGINNQEVHINYNQYGKPYLSNNSKVYFNLSHSGKWIICGWSTHEIGVDIEQVIEFDIADMEQCLARSEKLMLESIPVSNRGEMAIELWTLKESYAKYKGLGLYLPLNTFSFELTHPIQYKGVVEDNLYFYQMYVADDYKLAICCEDRNVTGVELLSLEQIYNTLKENTID